MPKDRFKKISNNYGELFSEVFSVQGLSYQDAESSVFNEVSKRIPDFRGKAILDIGIGDGETIAKFVDAGCKKLVGLDLNPTMLAQSKNRFEDKVQLVQGDARNLHMFQKGDFAIVISGATIHNTPKEERAKIWKGLVRLDPELIVMFDKIADDDPNRHQRNYENEVSAIDTVYRKRHGLEEEAKEWEKHYEQDEKEKLYKREIVESLGGNYDIEIVLEVGMSKTVVCTNK